MRRASLGLAVVAAVVGSALGAVTSCADATQLRLIVRDERVDCGKGPVTRIYSGAPGALGDVPKAETKACAQSGVAGDVVFTPSDPEAPVEIRVEAKLDGRSEPCVEGKPDCIVARRRFGFVKRRGLALTVTLDGRCAGVTCSPTETCFAGSCTSSLATCEGDACTIAPERDPDGGAADAAVDAPPDALVGDGGPAVDGGDGGDPAVFCGAIDREVPGIAGVTKLVFGGRNTGWWSGFDGTQTMVGRISRDPTKWTQRTISGSPVSFAAGDDGFLVRAGNSTTLHDPRPGQPGVVVSTSGQDTAKIALAPPGLLGAAGAVNVRDIGAASMLVRGGSQQRCSTTGAVDAVFATDDVDVFVSGTDLYSCLAAPSVPVRLGGALASSPLALLAFRPLSATRGLLAWAATNDEVGVVDVATRVCCSPWRRSASALLPTSGPPPSPRAARPPTRRSPSTPG